MAGGDPDNNTYELVFKESPNYESPADADGNNMYHVTIITTDNEGASSELPLVITVTNEDEPGSVSLLDHPTGGRAAYHGHAHRPRHEESPRSSGSGVAPIQPVPPASLPSRAPRLTTYTPVMTVEDDPVTSENEGVDGDEGMYLEVTVKYFDNAKDEGWTTLH